MHILCVGISHQTAPVELRERVALSEGAMASLLGGLSERYPHAEMVGLSTCNRTELYVARPLHGHPRVEEVLEALAADRNIEAQRLTEAAYHHDNEAAIRHAMRVASGLESMVMGENQILGQVKRGYELAQEAGTVGKVLHQVFQSAIAAGKRVRTETKIGTGPASVSTVAVDFARHLFHDFSDKTVLTIGAGKMTELTLGYFMEMEPARLLVCNRSREKAEDLAGRYGGEAVGLEDLGEHLVGADVVISSTGADEPIVGAKWFRPLVKRRRFRPLFIIDIAVPRDFEAAVGQLANVYLYDMDDLQAAIADQMAQRNGELTACERLIEESVGGCYASVQTQDFGQLIKRLREQLHDIGEAEKRRTVNKLRQADGEEVEKLLDEHTRRLVNKILHRPISELGRGGATEAAMFATALRRLFELDHEEPEDLRPPEATQPRRPAADAGSRGENGSGEA